MLALFPFLFPLSLTLILTICPSVSLSLQKGPHYVAQTGLQLCSSCLSFSSSPCLPDTLFCTRRGGSLTMHVLHSQAAAGDPLTARRPSDSPASSSPLLRGPRTRLRVTRPRPTPSCFSSRLVGAGRGPQGPRNSSPTPGPQPPLHPRGPLRDPAAAAADPSHPPGGCRSEPPRCTETPLLPQRRRRRRSRRLFGRAGQEEATPTQVRWSRPPPHTERQHFPNFIWGLREGSGGIDACHQA